MDNFVRRGRPKSFDAGTALDLALLLFWRQGYEGTSIADLTVAVGATAPTLYAAFGSKADLYAKALDRYRSKYSIDQQIINFQSEPSARKAFEDYFRASVKLLSDVVTPPGCLVLSASLLAAPENLAALKAAANLRHESLDMFTRKLEAAVKAGQLPGRTNPRHIATFYAAFAQGLAAQSCDGASPEALDAAVDAAMMAWPHP